MICRKIKNYFWHNFFLLLFKKKVNRSVNGIAEAEHNNTRVASQAFVFLYFSSSFCVSYRIGRLKNKECVLLLCGLVFTFVHRLRDTQERRDGDEGGGGTEAEDEDCVHAGARIALCPNDREASAGGHERGSLQLLPWVPRVPPGNPRQPPRRHGEHRYSLRRHARHQGTIRPPDSIFIFHILPFLFDLYLFYLFIFSSPILFWFTFKSCVLIANVYDWIRLCISGCYYYYYLILAQLCMCVEVKCWDLST